MITPTIRRELQFLTLSGVEGVQLSGDAVIGQFKPKLVEIGGTRKVELIERFVNWPDDAKSVVRFTRKYGPLKIPASPGVPFEFHLDEFKAAQEQFRNIWRNPRKHSALELLSLDGSLRFHKGSITYTAPTLYAYLYADLATSPAERIRICKREECRHPYFIAGHLKQQFCSDACAEEGQRVLKREWWEKHGQSWRANRRREITEGVKNGLKKTR
jgi:hypothetical protein